MRVSSKRNINRYFQLLGESCCICGYRLRGEDTRTILQFHHCNEKHKSLNIRQAARRSLHQFLMELQKGIIVCPNCHSEIHHNILPDAYIKKLYINIWKDIKKTKKWQDLIKKPSKASTYCLECGSAFGKNNMFCSKDCRDKYQRKVKKRPSLKTLVEEVDTLGYRGTGKKYNVSDNTIRRWIKRAYESQKSNK